VALESAADAIVPPPAAGERAAQERADRRRGSIAATDLENIDRAANILPMRHSDVFFALLMHIDMTRTRLVARAAALQRLNSAA
jgi:hypothetical protein